MSETGSITGTKVIGPVTFTVTLTPEWATGPQANLNTSPGRGRFPAVLVSNNSAGETRGPTNHVVIESSEPVTDLAVTVAFFGTTATERMRNFTVIPSVSGQGSLDPSNVVVPTAADGTVVLTWAAGVRRVEFDWTAAGGGASLVGTAVTYTTGVCDMGDAPESYGSAHAVGATPVLVLGASFTADLADHYSPDATGDTDDALTAPLLSVSHDTGVTYNVTVPLRNSTPNPATLQGWIDFDRSGTFEASEGTAVAVPAGATSAALTWTTGTHAGPSFVRLRLHQDPASLVGPTGPSVGGEVEDYAVTINDAPVITGPADGTATNDNTPTITGTGTPGDRIEVRDPAGNVLCTVDAVPASGVWSCTSGTLTDGTHTLTPVATAPDGTRSTGSPIAITIDTVPPPPPQITSPADGSTTTDPTPDITGTSEDGTTVTVRDETGNTVCTGVADDRSTFTCTPSPFTSGVHSLTPTATDAAGNVATGATVEFTVIASPTTVVPPPTLPATGRLHTMLAAIAAALTASGVALLTLARRAGGYDQHRR